MGAPDGSQSCRIPTLTQYCYRYINSHLNSILSLGDTPYRLCEPILRSCSAEQLLAIEKSSPHLAKEDQAVWQGLCFREFPRYQHQLQNTESPGPECWRKQYFVSRKSEEERLEKVGSRIRTMREAADQEKKEKQVILTDRLPPAKKSRYNSGPTKPKTLFEKTRAESIKIQRSVYGPAMVPSMPTRPTNPRSASSPSVKATAASSRIKLPGSSRIPGGPSSQSSTSPSPTKPPELPPADGNGTPKKDPMATLFIPKHRAHSQLPDGPSKQIRRT